VPSGLEPLVRQLAALPADERQRVVAAAELEAVTAISDEGADQRRRGRWQRLRALAGVVDLGGNALEDCEQLYDG
jgi:hypothetical protein